MTETCDHLCERLDAYADNELDTAQSLTVIDHLKTCAACRARLDGILALRETLRRDDVRVEIPPDFAAQLRTSLYETTPKPLIFRPKPSWRTTIVSGAGGAIAAGLAVLLIAPSLAPEAPGTAEQLLASHVRALQVQHLVDVQSSDHHTVKPWFAGKLDFTPPVVTLTRSGCALIGGRLDYIDHRTVAAMAYQCRKHVVDLYVAPTDDVDRDPVGSTVRGYNLVSWRQNHLKFDAISDYNAAELHQFSQDIREAAPGT